MGVTLSSLDVALSTRNETDDDAKNESHKGLSFLGSMLFQRCVSGTRVIPRHGSKTIADHRFEGWGASVEGYPYPYLTAACAIGLTETELNNFCERLDKALGDFRKKRGLAMVEVRRDDKAPMAAKTTDRVDEGAVEDLTVAWQTALSTKRW